MPRYFEDLSQYDCTWRLLPSNMVSVYWEGFHLPTINVLICSKVITSVAWTIVLLSSAPAGYEAEAEHCGPIVPEHIPLL